MERSLIWFIVGNFALFLSYLLPFEGAVVVCVKNWYTYVTIVIVHFKGEETIYEKVMRDVNLSLSICKETFPNLVWTKLQLINQIIISLRIITSKPSTKKFFFSSITRLSLIQITSNISRQIHHHHTSYLRIYTNKRTATLLIYYFILTPNQSVIDLHIKKLSRQIMIGNCFVLLGIFECLRRLDIYILSYPMFVIRKVYSVFFLNEYDLRPIIVHFHSIVIVVVFACPL